MTDVITIPVQALGALFFAALMSVHAGILAAMAADDIPTSGGEAAIIAAGWLWWAALLWLVVSA